MLSFIILLATIMNGAFFVEAETVDVEHRGSVDLKPFTCQDITRSSVINRVCYDQTNRYLLIQMEATYHHYCEISDRIVGELLNAPSMGKYFNANIKEMGSEGLHDCEAHPPPKDHQKTSPR